MRTLQEAGERLVDSLYVLVFIMVGAAVFGFGYWVGMNKTNQAWHLRMTALERKLRRDAGGPWRPAGPR